MIRTCFSGSGIGKIGLVCQAKFNLPAWGGIVGATHWLELKAGAMIGEGAETVTGGA